MLSQIFVVFVLTVAVFLLGASIGQLVLRIRLEKLERRNLQLDEERLNLLTRSLGSHPGSKAIIVEHRGVRFERDVRDEINEIISKIENG